MKIDSFSPSIKTHIPYRAGALVLEAFFMTRDMLDWINSGGGGEAWSESWVGVRFVAESREKWKCVYVGTTTNDEDDEDTGLIHEARVHLANSNKQKWLSLVGKPEYRQMTSQREDQAENDGGGSGHDGGGGDDDEPADDYRPPKSEMMSTRKKWSEVVPTIYSCTVLRDWIENYEKQNKPVIRRDLDGTRIGVEASVDDEDIRGLFADGQRFVYERRHRRNLYVSESNPRVAILLGHRNKNEGQTPWFPIMQRCAKMPAAAGSELSGAIAWVPRYRMAITSSAPSQPKW